MGMGVGVCLAVWCEWVAYLVILSNNLLHLLLLLPRLPDCQPTCLAVVIGQEYCVGSAAKNFTNYGFETWHRCQQIRVHFNLKAVEKYGFDCWEFKRTL